jgi:hypothetical protein
MSGPTSVPSRRWIADRQSSEHIAQATDQFVDNVFVHDHAPHGRAALPRRSRGGEHDPACGELEVGRRRHHGRVVASQLKQAPAAASGHARRHLRSHPLRNRALVQSRSQSPQTGESPRTTAVIAPEVTSQIGAGLRKSLESSARPARTCPASRTANPPTVGLRVAETGSARSRRLREVVTSLRSC